MNDLKFNKNLSFPDITLYQFDSNDDWDDIEILPIAQVSENVFEPCDIGKEKFWSVFLHLQGGGVICVADFPTNFLAVQFANFLYKQRVKNVKIILGNTHLKDEEKNTYQINYLI